MAKKQIIQKTKKSSKAVEKWGKSKVKWVLDEAFQNRRDLQHVSRKLQRICELKSRIDIEAPDLGIEKLIERLKRRKKELIKKVSMNTKEAKKFIAAFRSPNPGGPTERAPLTLEEYHAQKTRPDLATILPGYWADKACEIDQGWKRYDWFFPYAWEYSDPDSEVSSFYAEWETFESLGSYLFRGELVDDGSGDEPDQSCWGQEFGWILPKAECDAKAICDITVRVVSEFTNAADENGYLGHAVHFADSDENGNLPNEAKIGGLYDVVISRLDSGHSDSGWCRYSISFDVNAGAQGKLAVLVRTSLEAEDGLVEVYGSWSVDRSIYYTLIPK